MTSSRHRAVAALASCALYVVYAVACSSFESTPVDETDASDSSVDAPSDNAPTNDANGGSDASDAAADARDASLAVVCPIGMCRVVFVTSIGMSGTLGGINGADKLCDNLALDAGSLVKDRTFKSWLSQSDADARDLHAHDLNPYVRVDGVTVAKDWSKLITASSDAAALEAPIEIDETGKPVGNSLVWTGTTYLGQASGNTCGNWTKGSGTAGQVGRSNQVNEEWTDTDNFSPTPDCGGVARLYCFEK